MKNLILIFVISILLSKITVGQVKNETLIPAKLNVGISTGLVGLHFFFLPALELKFYGISLRGNYGFFYWSYGIDYEFKKIESEFLSKYFDSKHSTLLLSFHNNKQHLHLSLDRAPPIIKLNDIYSVTFGIKVYTNDNIAFTYKVGAAVNHYYESYIGPNDIIRTFGNEYYPFGELSVKIYILGLKNLGE